ncbi:MAG: nuclear transport factor 2 family protein [Solirubrobacteraceae bacterium]
MAERFDAWVCAYRAAWRAAGTGALNDLFTADATYQAAPFDDPVVGLDAIARFWEAEREGPDEAFQLSWEIIAAQDDTAVARAQVVYDGPPSRTYRDLWIITLTTDGHCSRFEEWPFHPGQARTAR